MRNLPVKGHGIILLLGILHEKKQDGELYL